MPRILVTGATGKVGQRFISRLLADPAWSAWTVRALCHHRLLPAAERLEVIQGSIAERSIVAQALEGVSHVLHLATCKEIPEDVMDVTVKGLFWLLEECRGRPGFERFVLIGGDAAVGHFVYPQPVPVTETTPHTAYQGCYALSKVLEEVMLEQYYRQYDFDGCCLRAPWIMDADDFRYTLSFGDEVFGGQKWQEWVGPEEARAHHAAGAVPNLLDAAGGALKRNFVHVDDLVEAVLLALTAPQARQQLFNISMDEPVDYAQVCTYLLRTRGLPSVTLKTPFHSSWLDNTKARSLLGWRPRYDLARLIDSAFDYQRPATQPRRIWYPG